MNYIHISEFLGLPTIEIRALDSAQRVLQEATWLEANRPGAQVTDRTWSECQLHGFDDLKLEHHGHTLPSVIFRVVSEEPLAPAPGLNASHPVRVASLAEEYAWIGRFLGGMPQSQALHLSPEGPRDVITVVLPDGSSVPVWFDVSSFF